MYIDCDSTDSNYPYTSLGIHCPAFDRCAHNYREDENGNTCSEFNNCLTYGDGTGDIDNVTGLSCDYEDNLFEAAKAEFDLQMPLIMFADVDQIKTVHLDFIEQDEYKGIIELEADFGNARSFVDFDSDTGEIDIKPDEKHVGDYKLKVTLVDSYEEYAKTMLLKILSSEIT